MRIPIWHKNGTWNLKIFFSISLGFHLLSLSILTLLFQDFKIDRLSPLHIEVSLLPLISEAKPLPEVIASPTVKAQIRKEEIKAPQKMREEESAAKKEQEQEQKISAFPTATKNISLEEPTLLLPESRKWEIGNEKEEKVAKEPILQEMAVKRPLESSANDKSEDLKPDNKEPSLNVNKEEPPPKKEIRPEIPPPIQTVSSPSIVNYSQPIPTIPSSRSEVSPEEKRVPIIEKKEGQLAPYDSRNTNQEKERVSQVQTAWSPPQINDAQPIPVENKKEGKGVTEPIIERNTNSLPSEKEDISNITSSEGPQHVTKIPSPSDGEDIFTQPKYAENPKPLYPREARKKGYQGEVVLRVEVLANGKVGQVEIKKSSGYEVLDRSALTAIKQWKFIPANKGDESIPCWVNIPIKFQLQ